MRCLSLVVSVLVMTMPALAKADDFLQAQAIGNWTGCVDQPGYDPYPVRLKATELGLDVDYPGLCSGQHSLVGALASSNALEVITGKVDNCVPVAPVSYRLRSGRLSLEYFHKGSVLATAYLVPGEHVAKCAGSKAIS